LLADYLADQGKQKISNLGLSVSDMTVKRPLVATGSEQLFRASATADWANRCVRIKIYSTDKAIKAVVHHAECVVRLENTGTWQQDWKRVARLIKSRVDALHGCSDSDGVNQVTRGVAYKLFSVLVDYGKSYQGMEKVAFDSSQHEGSAMVKFQSELAKDFFFSPYCIDSLGHLAGFIMNATEAVDSKAQVFINHGWEAMQVSKKLDSQATYHTYVRIQDAGRQLYSGDVYILEGSEVVALYSGVKVSEYTESRSKQHANVSLVPRRASSSAERYLTLEHPNISCGASHAYGIDIYYS